MIENKYRQEILGGFVPPENPFEKMPWSRDVQGVSISKLSLQEQSRRVFELGSSLHKMAVPSRINLTLCLSPSQEPMPACFEVEVLEDQLPYVQASYLGLSPSLRTLNVLGNRCIWDGGLKRLGDIYLMDYLLPAAADYSAKRSFPREALEIMDEWDLQHSSHEARWPEGPIRYLLSLFIRSRDWGQ